MPKSAVETLFDQLDQTTQLIEKNLETTYLDALTETIANIADGGRVKVEDGLPDAATVAQLEPLYAAVNLNQFEAEEIRQALQLATLKGLRQVKVEPNKQMTPDAIGYLVAYLAEVFGGADQIKTILDPVVGTGNLLATVINHIQKLTGIPCKVLGLIMMIVCWKLRASVVNCRSIQQPFSIRMRLNRYWLNQLISPLRIYQLVFIH
ncbi:hypothetical protein [Latilactobacillus curvatus]|uniref:hypothetical protein n=1 Tax=Latilactobacillus curvatus TaxID=28038 RepID=UPI0020A42C67|nr:hypothetical protein [Latilactobacillus curvatus]